MPFKLSNLNSNLALTLGYLNPALNNAAQEDNIRVKEAVLIKNGDGGLDPPLVYVALE